MQKKIARQPRAINEKVKELDDRTKCLVEGCVDCPKQKELELKHNKDMFNMSKQFDDFKKELIKEVKKEVREGVKEATQDLKPLLDMAKDEEKMNALVEGVELTVSRNKIANFITNSPIMKLLLMLIGALATLLTIHLSLKGRK